MIPSIAEEIRGDSLFIQLTALQELTENLATEIDQFTADIKYLKDITDRLWKRQNILRSDHTDLATITDGLRSEQSVLHKVDGAILTCLGYQTERINSAFKKVSVNQGLQASLAKAVSQGFHCVNNNEKINQRDIEQLNKAFDKLKL